ncbi:uncharacterized protein B0I36DRAFT_434550 [Microdochium trichocladiopsis]|uniref:Uncharacterized protein n=1 Tax=Microdochium trichocladiopsis TaxID=1682393 RepID=A0A9P8XXE9_9PEZI|nr:uncharacterized protein B0I36DRAFT_434550 [Microdochium trichocladiopsis]KAH7025019.1 hypothetical protein B0I36DRAFT_434550 [Microdochium trichocladiopsis]
MSELLLSHRHDELRIPPSVTLSACTMSYDDNSDSLSLDQPGQWEVEAEELCQVLGIGPPEYLLGSDQRGTHTAWGYAVRLEATYLAPRYWYTWENRHNAKEATAEELVRNIYKNYYNSQPEPPRKRAKKKGSHSRK